MKGKLRGAAKKILSLVIAFLVVLGTAGLTTKLPVKAADNTGTITVNNPQAGKVYSLYKLFDATVDSDRSSGKSENGIAYNYTVSPGKDLTTTFRNEKTGNTVSGTNWFDIDNAGNVTAKETTDKAALATDDFQFWAKSFAGNAIATKTADATNPQQIVFDNLPDGYYFLTSTMGSLISVTSIRPNQTVFDKNEAPQITKTESVKTSSIGDTVTYTVMISIPSKDVGEGRIILHDRLDDRLILGSKDNAKITINAADGTALDPSNYSIDYWNTTKSTAEGITKGDNITITFNENYVNNLESQTTLYLTYNATLSARSGINMPNEAYLVYGNSNLETVHRIVYESAFNFTLKKVDKDTKDPLDGAEFVLSTNGNINNGVLTESNYSNYKTELMGFDKGGIYNPSSTDYLLSGSSIDVKGLNNDESNASATQIIYYLYEVKAPNGYAKLDKPVAIRITPTMSENSSEDQGTHVESYKVEYQLPNTTEWISSTTSDNDITGPEATGLTENHNVIIQNTEGRVLPSTGGMGTRLFYIIGGILVAGAVILLVVRRKRTH